MTEERKRPLFELTGKRVYVAGHRGMVGSALVRRLASERCRVLTVDRAVVDLTNQTDTEHWISAAKPDAVVLAAARVGGIAYNNEYPVDFLFDNLSAECSRPPLKRSFLSAKGLSTFVSRQLLCQPPHAGLGGWRSSVRSMTKHKVGRLTCVSFPIKLTHMEKTQVYLRKEELDALRKVAARSRRSVAALVREAVRKVVLMPAAEGPVAIWDGEPKRSSLDHDSVHDEL